MFNNYPCILSCVSIKLNHLKRLKVHFDFNIAKQFSIVKYVVALAWRPVHLTATDKVQMQMVDRLCTVFAVVDDNTIAIG